MNFLFDFYKLKNNAEFEIKNLTNQFIVNQVHNNIYSQVNANQYKFNTNYYFIPQNNNCSYFISNLNMFIDTKSKERFLHVTLFNLLKSQVILNNIDYEFVITNKNNNKRGRIDLLINSCYYNEIIELKRVNHSIIVRSKGNKKRVSKQLIHTVHQILGYYETYKETHKNVCLKIIAGSRPNSLDSYLKIQEIEKQNVNQRLSIYTWEDYLDQLFRLFL